MFCDYTIYTQRSNDNRIGAGQCDFGISGAFLEEEEDFFFTVKNYVENGVLSVRALAHVLIFDLGEVLVQQT